MLTKKHITNTDPYIYRVLENENVINGIEPIPYFIKFSKTNLIKDIPQTIQITNTFSSIKLCTINIHKNNQVSKDTDIDLVHKNINGSLIWECNLKKENLRDCGKFQIYEVSFLIINPNSTIEITSRKDADKLEIYGKYIHIETQ